MTFGGRESSFPSMPRTGRPPSDAKMIPRTVRNHPDVDAVLVRMAAEYRKALPAVMREACEALAGRFEGRDGSEVGRVVKGDCRGSQEGKQ